jgi:hypothetical protein
MAKPKTKTKKQKSTQKKYNILEDDKKMAEFSREFIRIVVYGASQINAIKFYRSVGLDFMLPSNFGNTDTLEKGCKRK